MHSEFVREQRRYTQKELCKVFSCSEDKTVSIIRKLKEFGVLKAVKAEEKQRDMSELVDEDIEVSDVEIGENEYLYVFTYVGIIVVSGIVLKCYPKYLLTSTYPERELTQVIKVLDTDSIIYSARYGRTKLTTSKIIAALEVVIGTYLLYLLLNLVLYGCTYGLQGWNVSIQSSLHYASSIYNLTFLQMFFISVILNIFGIVALTTITLFLSAQMSSPVTALITSCVICFLPVVFDFNDSLPVLQKMQEICPIFMLHTNGIFSDMKTYFGMSQPVFMIILNVGLIFVFYRLTKNISKKHQVTG